jgi:hypothetical protein
LERTLLFEGGVTTAPLMPPTDLINESLDRDQPALRPAVDAVISAGRLPERADLGHDVVDEWWVEQDDTFDTRVTIRR